MKDQYVADIGDFAKYGIIRALCRQDQQGPGFTSGIVWYLTPSLSTTRDGQQTGYLDPTLQQPSEPNLTRHRACDPELYDALRRLVRTNNRRVRAVREAGILPNATFHEDIFRHNQADWLEAALRNTQQAQLVLLDPDIGIRLTQPRTDQGNQHLDLHHLDPFFHRGQSLLVYHHLNRTGTLVQQFEQIIDVTSARLGCRPFLLRHHRGSPRAFLALPQEHHHATLYHHQP